MRQYTSKEQTAKLIELGLPKPKSISGYCQRSPYVYDAESNTKMVVYDDTQYPIYAYSIGELIEMLPSALSLNNDEDCEFHLMLFDDSLYWHVRYVDSCYSTLAIELIDALFDMVIKLKEEGIIQL